MSLSPNPFSITELLEDAAFQRWMKERRQEDQLFWEEWLQVYPEKRELYEQAVAAFLVIKGKEEHITDQEVSLKAEQILERIPDEALGTLKPLLGWTWLRWAAAIIIISLATWYQFQTWENPQSVTLTTRNEEKTVEVGEWQLVNNTTQQPMVVLLPDNSSVLLSEGSSLRFRKEITTNKREVFLQGEGFFEVTKDPKKPFFVYTNSLTTKVLGTSFQVRAFEGEAMALVKVKSGKVAVTSVISSSKPTLLTEHQQLSIVTKTNEVIQKASEFVAENPSAIINQQFTYEYAPVSEIFSQLQEAYHLPIQYEQDKLKSCTFTGQLNDVPFLEKIRLICLTIEATYEVVDDKVIIRSQGCN